MSVDRTDYIFFGWKLTNGEIPNYWDVIDSQTLGDFDIIPDQMLGKYIVFGKQVKRASEYDGWDFVDLNLFFTKDYSQGLIEKYKEIVGKDPLVDPKLFIFTNFN